MVKPIEKSQAIASSFGRDLIGELKKVSWPSKNNTIRLTIIVIVISLIIAFYIGIIDFLLAIGLEFMTKYN